MTNYSKIEELKREVSRRLSAGEEPIDIVLDKIALIITDETNTLDILEANTCAFCILYNDYKTTTDKANTCGDCPINRIYHKYPFVPACLTLMAEEFGLDTDYTQDLHEEGPTTDVEALFALLIELRDELLVKK